MVVLDPLGDAFEETLELVAFIFAAAVREVFVPEAMSMVVLTLAIRDGNEILVDGFIRDGM